MSANYIDYSFGMEVENYVETSKENFFISDFINEKIEKFLRLEKLMSKVADIKAVSKRNLGLTHVIAKWGLLRNELYRQIFDILINIENDVNVIDFVIRLFDDTYRCGQKDYSDVSPIVQKRAKELQREVYDLYEKKHNKGVWY